MSVLEKTSSLIDCLGQAGEPVSLAYVRSALDMPKSSTHRLLGELAALGIVRRTEGGRYSLGPRLLYWGEAAAETFDLRTVAEPPMRRLRDELGESVHLYVRDHDKRVCIAAVEARHELRPFIQLGRPLPLRAGAAGKLLLAFADDEIQRLELRRARTDGDTLPNAPGPRLADQLEQIRAERWATSVGERQDGVAAVATAVSDSRGRVVAALCISGPTTRLTRERLPAMREPLEACAAEVTGLLRRG
ncbi:MAG TPA: IclR family transcriptional regulator [Candidatus Limnocylindrales bacterium]|nr:IclR family transcriptional regulator [Candidatus Limnocylindrales bacterium]